ncbi:nuclear transport factor 2 family protein [Rhodococcus sp. WS3]|uniref:nuclear transport factor 2 family protein n=1 Tax=Rhodococcus sp. WS3 TaxID=2486271 RepID=UPI00114228EB|nr:nuclear transport factor 2 family protein [Rhodococcus sp. WS3]ROZ45635.1 nuclear transport factor 2 family protein [Rhodococcus sp. WS3]
MSEMLDLADKMFGALVLGNVAVLDKIYHSDVKIWHNWDDAEQSREDNLRILSGIPTRYDEFHYDNPRCTVLEDGFLRQHVIRATIGDKTVNVPTIFRVFVDGGKVRRIEEYLDAGQLRKVFA